jgi:hypothetical protein
MIKLKKKLCDGCRLEKPIWKNDGGKRFCKQCWSAHSAATRTKPTAQQKKIPPKSSKRITQDNLYGKKRKLFLTAHSICKASIRGVCNGAACDIHHMKGRIGDLFLDETYWLPVCRACHYWIEMRPEAAKELGFSINRLTK